jgi:GT2 family glycosyltransferase
MSPFIPTLSRISFVVATYNRGPTAVECLRRTLACAAAVFPPESYSAVIVDNASTDGTPDLLEALARETGRIQIIRLQKNCGPIAKNLGLHSNPADLLVLLDDDAYPLPGALMQMVRHFRADPHLGAAVFDVTLPDGRKEASAYPDVFIGAGTALRGAALRSFEGRFGKSGGLLPPDYFMQAEEYDLSFRLLECGWSIQRFWDMPLIHLKSPGARIGQRTTRLDVRNNLYLLAKYLPAPLCHELAADWLARYWLMALQRDQAPSPPHPASHAPHKTSYLQGMAEGLTAWNRQRAGGRWLLSPPTLERIFKFERIAQRLQRLRDQKGIHRIAFGDLGKNLLAFHRGAQQAGLEVAAVLDEALATREHPGDRAQEYRGVPLVNSLAGIDVDAIVITAMSPVHAQRRADALRRVLGGLPVVDLFSMRDGPLRLASTAATESALAFPRSEG